MISTFVHSLAMLNETIYVIFRDCEGHCISFSQILTTSASTTSTTTALSFIIRLVNVPRRVWNEVLAQKTLRRNVRELTVDTNISRIKETVSLPAEKSNFGEIKVEWSWVIYLKANVRQKAWFRQSRAHSSTLWASRLSRTITLYSLKPWRDRRKQSAKNRNNYGNDFFHGDKNCSTPKSGAKMMVAKNTHMFLKNKTENTLQCIHVFGGKLWFWHLW